MTAHRETLTRFTHQFPSKLHEIGGEGLPVIDNLPSATPSVIFQFGSNRLWVDRVETLSQAEIWLEVNTTHVPAAARHLKESGVVRRDEIEALDFEAFWITSPAGIIHLVAGEEDA